MGYVWTGIGVSDTGAWSRLTRVLADHDGTGEYYQADDLAEELGERGVDPARDTVAAWSGGEMVAFGQLRVADTARDGAVRAHLAGGVHPGHRGLGLGRAVMDRLEPRARVLAGQRHPGTAVQLQVEAGVESTAGRLARARGYRPVRFFHAMRTELDGAGRHPVPPSPPFAPPAPGGAAVVPFSPELSEAVRLAHNEAFADHWGSVPRSPERWAETTTAARSFRPGLSRVALAPGPGPAGVDAYVLCAEWEPGELYVSLVGTRPRARGRGLAGWLLADVVAAARHGGYRRVDLHVDADSPTGAVGLYERAGFDRVRTSATFARREGPG